ncbi:MAG: hypothetical protein Q9210_003864 [Variospora velana]
MVSPHSSYAVLPRYDSDKDSDIDLPEHQNQRRQFRYVWRDVVIALLAAANLALVVLYLRSAQGGGKPWSSSYIGLDIHPAKRVQYHWWSAYGSSDENQTAAVDAAWEAIHPAHGIVVIDHKWAAEQQLPASMDFPSDKSKGVYELEAYHMLHCLTRMRKSYYALARGDSFDDPGGHHHMAHCYDSLRQYIMCTAGDTPLYTWGGLTSADNQARKCRDWDRLRDWATEHSACVKDSAVALPVEEYFGFCDDGVDGLITTGK